MTMADPMLAACDDGGVGQYSFHTSRSHHAKVYIKDAFGQKVGVIKRTLTGDWLVKFTAYRTVHKKAVRMTHFGAGQFKIQEQYSHPEPPPVYLAGAAITKEYELWRGMKAHGGKCIGRVSKSLGKSNTQFGVEVAEDEADLLVLTIAVAVDRALYDESLEHNVTYVHVK